MFPGSFTTPMIPKTNGEMLCWRPIGMEKRNLRLEDSIEHNSRGITELLVIDEGTNENKNSE